MIDFKRFFSCKFFQSDSTLEVDKLDQEAREVDRDFFKKDWDNEKVGDTVSPTDCPLCLYFLSLDFTDRSNEGTGIRKTYHK